MNHRIAPSERQALVDAKYALTGPVISVRTPFLPDGEIDFEAMRRMIDRGIEGGTRTLMLTVGDSHYDCLSDDEIAEVTRVVVSQAAHRVRVIAAVHATRNCR